MSRAACAALGALMLAIAGCASTVATSPPETDSPTLSSLAPVGTTSTQPVSLSTVPFTPPSSLPPGGSVCDAYTTASVLGALPGDDLTEVSGIAASRTYPGIFWVHNDSGDAAVVYGVDPDAGSVWPVTLEGVFALDWEDIGIGPGPDPGGDYLYLGDIGDNFEFRPEVSIYRIPEPEPGVVASAPAEEILLRYPDGPHDAEALFVDPLDGSIVIVTKGTSDERPAVFQSPGDVQPGTRATMELVAELELGGQVTAADISPDATVIALRGYRAVWLWQRTDTDLAIVFSAQPCRAPSPSEVQGEAISFEPTGSAYVTTSEGAGAPFTRIGSP